MSSTPAPAVPALRRSARLAAGAVPAPAVPALRRPARIAARVVRASAPAPAAPCRSARLAARRAARMFARVTAAYRAATDAEEAEEERQAEEAAQDQPWADADARAWWEAVRDTMVEPCDYEPPTTSHHKLTIIVKYTDGEVMTWCGNIPWNMPNGRPWDFSKMKLHNPNSPGNDVKYAQIILIEDVHV